MALSLAVHTPPPSTIIPFMGAVEVVWFAVPPRRPRRGSGFRNLGRVHWKPTYRHTHTHTHTHTTNPPTHLSTPESNLFVSL